MSRLLGFLLVIACGGVCLGAQETSAPAQASERTAGSISGTVADTDTAFLPGATVQLESPEAKTRVSATTDASGSFRFSPVVAGQYVVTIAAKGFAAWHIKDVLVVHEGESVVLPQVQLGVEEITTNVNAITLEDLAEEQITAEEHQRILGILPNFYVSYVPHAAPLTRRQKFKLALVVSTDPVTFFTTGVTAGIEDWQGGLFGVWSWVFRLCRALCGNLWRSAQLDLSGGSAFSIAAAPGPTLLLPRARQGDYPGALCNFDDRGVQGRQRQVAAELLECAGKPGFGGNLDVVLPGKRAA